MASEFVKLGRVAPVYRGAWNAGQTYERLDVVVDAYGTAAYIARRDISANTSLTDETAWGLLVNLTGKKADAIAGQDSGNPVSIYPDEGSPLRVTAQMIPIQTGSGEPCMPGMGRNIMPPWEQGNVNGTTGNEADSSKVIRSVFVPVTPGSTYTLWRSASGGNFTVRGYGADKSFIGSGSTSISLVSGGSSSNPIAKDRQKAVVKVKDGVYFLRFTDDLNDLSVQYYMEEGNIATVEFVPYDNERPVVAPNPLTIAVGGKTYSRTADPSFYGGEMHWDTGKLTSEWGFIELNGTENNWNTGTGNFFIEIPRIIRSVSDLICNRFVNAPTVSVNGMKGNQMRQGNTPGNVVFGNPTGMTKAEWLALLAEHPVQLAFRLEAPEEDQLKPLDLRGAAGENILSTNGSTMEVSYNKSLKKSFEEITNANAEVIAAQVQKWLDEHPEATTTLQDGAVTKDKLSADLYQELKPPYLTPQMFGCVCDGVTDDTEGFRQCIAAAANQKLPVMVNGSMFLSGTITVPRGVSVSGVIYSEFYPRIFVGPDCTLLFDCVDVQNTFRDIWIQTADGKYRDTLTVFDFHGNSDLNVDSELRNVTMCYANKAVVVRGRNVKVEGGLISHCRYGVYYDFPEAADYLRGLQVEFVRFHGVGEEPAINFENSAAIYIRNNTRSNLTVRDCICDQGGTFLDGYATEVLIENNFVECFNKPALVIEAPEGTYHPNNMGSWTIVGNHFKGASDGAAYGMAVTPPDNLVRIRNYGRILFSNNKLGHCGGDAIYLKNVIESAFIGNTFVRLRMKNDGTPCAFTLEGVNVAISQNKSLEDNTISLCRGIAEYDNVVQSSGNFTFGPSWNIRILQNRRFHQLFTGKTGTESTLSMSSIPDGDFIVRRTDGRSIWRCAKEDTYISTPAMVNADHSAIDYMQVTRNADTGMLTFGIDRLNTADNTWTTVAVDISVEVMF